MTRIFTALAAMLFAAPHLFGQQSTYCTPPTAMPKDPPADQQSATCEPKECKCTASPCYINSGIYVADDVDLSIPTNGFPLRIARHYDSSLTVDGPLGIGWSSSLTPHLYYATYLYGANVYQYEVDVVMPDSARYRFTDNGNGSFAPPPGRRDTLLRNANGTFTMTIQHTRSIYSFATDGSLTSMTDDFGNALIFAYDPNGRVQTVSDASGSGRTLTLAWDDHGRIASVHDSATPSRYITYSYNADGTLSGVRDPVTPSGQQSRKYSYTAGRFSPVLATVTDRWDRTITHLTWQNDAKLASYTDGDYNDANPSSSTGEKYVYTYNFNGLAVTRKTDSLGVVDHAYAAGGLITDHAQYDPATGNVTSRTDGAGFQTLYQYDSQGNLSRVSRNLPSDSLHPCCTMLVDWNYTYDVNFPNNVSAITPLTGGNNANLNFPAWTYEYNGPAEAAPGALKVVRRYNRSRTTTENIASYVHDAKGHVLTAMDSVGRAMSYTYDASGNMITKTSKDGVAETFTYDSVGRLTSRTDAAGHTTTFTYDGLDRLLSITLPRPSASQPLSFVTSFAYDNFENGLAYENVTDVNGHVVKKGRDALGHLVRTVDALGNSTVYAYQYSLLKSVTDANGNATSYAYDVNRNATSTTFPDGAIESYENGWDGTLLSVTDRRGIKTAYTRDGLGRITYIAYTSGGTTLGSTVYTFDGDMVAGVTTGPASQPQQSSFVYDPFWRLSSETRSGDYTITYLNTTGYQSGMSGYTIAPVAGQSGPTLTVTYGFDAYQRIHSIAWSAVTGSFSIDYNALAQYNRITLPNGQTRDLTYDDQGRLMTVANTRLDNIATFQYGYDYDASGAPTLLGERTSMASSGSATLNRQTRYGYDANYQLTSATAGGTTQSWQYDAIGNRIFAGYPWTYYKNGSNPLNGTRLRNDGGADFTYDANGNITGRVGQPTYTWDYANRLSAIAGAPSLSYAYDYLGRRTSTNWGGQVTKYLYHGLDVVGERTGAASRDYLYAPGLDEPLAMVENGTVTYYATDGLGSVVATTDSGGSVVAAAAYDPWGGVTYLRSPNTTGLFGFTARENDASGLTYYRARWYAPFYGRFLSEDAIARPHVTPYRYANNDPVELVDPLGLDAGGAFQGRSELLNCLQAAARFYKEAESVCDYERTFYRGAAKSAYATCLAYGPFWKCGAKRDQRMKRVEAVYNECRQEARGFYIYNVGVCCTKQPWNEDMFLSFSTGSSSPWDRQWDDER